MTHSKSSNHAVLPLIITVLGAGFVTGVIPAGLLPANVPDIEKTYHISHAFMGTIVGFSLTLGGAIGGLLGGWFCERIGALRVLLAALVMMVCSLLIVGLINSLFAMCAGLTGYFLSAAMMSSSNALATKMLPNVQRGVTLLHAFSALGKLAGPILAAFFLYGAWRHSFLFIAGIVLLMFVPAILAGRHRHANAGLKKKEDGRSRAGIIFWIACCGFAFIAGSEMAVALWVPSYALNIRGFSPSAANYLLTVFLLGLVVGRFAASSLSHHISSRQAILICGSTVIFLLPALYCHSYIATLFFFLLFGLAFSATWPSYFAYLSLVFPKHLGVLTGITVFWSYMGLAGGSFISGKLADINEVLPLAFGALVMGVFTIVFYAVSVHKSLKGVAQT